MISSKSMPKRREELEQRNLSDGSVLYDRKQERAYTLNITAALIWSYLEGTLSLQQIAEEVALASGGNVDDVLKDVLATVTYFHGNGLLQPGSIQEETHASSIS